jgi:hypothetical protein
LGDGTGTAQFLINGAAGALRELQFLSAGSGRWRMRADSTAESGANAGSDFSLLSRTDAGGALRTDLTITRSNGNWTIAGSVQSPTIVTPTIASLTNAQHTHLNAAGGGVLTDAAALAPASDPTGVFGGSAVFTFPSGIKVTSAQDNFNVFDEGTWSPTITGSGSNPTVTYTTRTGTYLKINSAVFCTCNIVINTISGGSGNVLVSLPFTASSTVHVLSAYVEGVDFAVAPASIVVITTASAATCSIQALQDNAANSPLQVSGVATTDIIRFSGVYFV